MEEKAPNHDAQIEIVAKKLLGILEELQEATDEFSREQLIVYITDLKNFFQLLSQEFPVDESFDPSFFSVPQLRRMFSSPLHTMTKDEVDNAFREAKDKPEKIQERSPDSVDRLLAHLQDDTSDDDLTTPGSRLEKGELYAITTYYLQRVLDTYDEMENLYDEVRISVTGEQEMRLPKGTILRRLESDFGERVRNLETARLNVLDEAYTAILNLNSYLQPLAMALKQKVIDRKYDPKKYHTKNIADRFLTGWHFLTELQNTRYLPLRDYIQKLLEEPKE